MTGPEKLPEPSAPLSIAIRHFSRRGIFGWVGKAGLVATGAGALVTYGLGATPASALGCPECWGPCSACSSTCCCPCSTACTCACSGGCDTCNPTFARAHLLWILGYIPNCTCANC